MIKVARNLKRRQYSLREGKKVVGYADTLVLTDCHFEVNQVIRNRVLRNKQKEVHAFVVGEKGEDKPLPSDAVEVTYNPYWMSCFYRKDNGARVFEAREVHFTLRGVFAVEAR